MDEPLSAAELTVARQGCDPPESGAFVRTSQLCDGRQVWRWTGELASGQTYDVRLADERVLMSFIHPGDLSAAVCPPDSPIHRLPHGTEVVLPSYGYSQYYLDGFVVEGTGDQATIAFHAGAHMRAAVLKDDTMLRSEAMPYETAIRLLAESERLDGKAFRISWKSTAVGHTEGTVKRGMIACEWAVKRTYDIEMFGSKVTLTGSDDGYEPGAPYECQLMGPTQSAK